MRGPSKIPMPMNGPLGILPSEGASTDPRSRGSHRSKPITGPSPREGRVSHMAQGLEGEHQEEGGPERERCHSDSEGPGRFIDVIV